MASRPTLQVQTVYFADSDEFNARALGLELYDTLTRRRSERLAFGPAIPVRVAVPHHAVDLQEADRVVSIPLLGAGSLQDEAIRESALSMSGRWSEAGSAGHLLPVLTSLAWRVHETRLGVTPLLTKILFDGEGWSHTLLAIVVSTCRFLREPGQRLHVFVSHAKRDLDDEGDGGEPATKRVAERIRDFVKAETIGEAFFDTTDLRPGRELEAQLAAAAGNGVFLAIRTDSYSSRAWCQRELLSAKRAGVPTLTVELLRDGEYRSSPYGGNGPTVRWTGDPHPVVLRAMVEWLRSSNFRHEASRLVGNLPRVSVLSRAPELLDLAQGPLLAKEPEVVLHPDPEIARAEREVLRAARPRLRLLTPTTLYRGVGPRLLGSERSASSRAQLPFAALRGRQIGLSLSAIVDDDGKHTGILPEHVDDCIVHVARSLVSAGAAIAYGGDFRIGGFDELLAQLISTYNEHEVDEADLLFSYVPASVPRSAIPDALPVTVRALGWTEPYKSDALLPAPSSTITDGRRALHVSDMRRLMTACCFARVAIGGQAEPRPDGEGEGYGGAYPGVVEEVWWSVRDGAPAYVIGGFGGAAAAAAALLTDGETPVMEERTWRELPGGARFRRIATEVHGDPLRETLGAPAGMDEMAESLRRYGRQLLANDDSSRAWNGLSIAENRELFWTRDPVRATGLVMTGLFELLASRSRGKINIELVRGSVTRVEGVDAVVVGVFRDVEIMGAGAALDAALSGRVTAAARARESIAELSGADVDADWLCLADLGELSKTPHATLLRAIENAAAAVGRVALRHGFRRLGIVTFGGTILRLEDAVGGMLDGLRRTSGEHPATLQWLELDPKRFDETRRVLENRPDVELTTRALSLQPIDPVPGPTDVVMVVRWRPPALECTILPPSGVAALGVHRAELPEGELSMLARPTASQAPPAVALKQMGLELASRVLGEANAALLEQYAGSRLVIQHDAASAAIPFETLRIGDERLSVERRMIRRPSLEGLDLVNLSRRPPSNGALQMLMIVNPTSDLIGTETEAEAVKSALVGMDGIAIKRQLWRGQATRSAVLAALSDPEIDLLHYAGHAFFTATGLGGSGIECADGTLFLKDLSGKRIAPRVVFFNACQSARVRGHILDEVSQAFAEYFLRAGVEAYLGTFWPVADQAAAAFAGAVYRALVRGEPLDAAVRLARAEIGDRNDWATYVLYGEGKCQPSRGIDAP